MLYLYIMMKLTHAEYTLVPIPSIYLVLQEYRCSLNPRPTTLIRQFWPMR
jgi:hypothetical protein